MEQNQDRAGPAAIEILPVAAGDPAVRPQGPAIQVQGPEKPYQTPNVTRWNT